MNCSIASRATWLRSPNVASNWLYNYDTCVDEPADLGYWIGAEICRSYYSQSKDKAKAIRDVVRLDSVEMIVRGSKYDWLLTPLPIDSNL